MRCFRKTIILIICLIFSKPAFAIDKVFEIQEAREPITQLNKLYPKPQLENWFGGGGKKSGTFKAQACKNSNKNKEVTYYSGNHTYDVFLACRITSASGYHDHLRTIADKKAKQMFDKANEFGSTGDAKLDENILSFWNTKVDDYFSIKNAMQTGKISKQEGNLALSRINGLVGQFKAQSKYLAEQTGQYREDFNNGAVSSTSSQQSQNILGAMAKGGNVQITERGGTLYYYLPGDRTILGGTSDSNGGNSDANKGYEIKQLVLYNKVVSDTERNTIYNSGTPLASKDLYPTGALAGYFFEGSTTYEADFYNAQQGETGRWKSKNVFGSPKGDVTSNYYRSTSDNALYAKMGNYPSPLLKQSSVGHSN